MNPLDDEHKNWTWQEVQEDQRKYYVLEMIRFQNHYAILENAPKEIQEICKGNDPIKALKTAIFADALEKALTCSKPSQQKPTTRMKI